MKSLPGDQKSGSLRSLVDHEKSLTPPKTVSNLSDLLMKHAAGKGPAPKKVAAAAAAPVSKQVAPASKQTAPISKQAAPSIPIGPQQSKTTGKQRPQASTKSDDDSAGAYLRVGATQKEKFDGKFVIPKILLESVPARRPDDVDEGYQMFGKHDDGSRRSANKDKSARPIEGPSVGSRSGGISDRRPSGGRHRGDYRRTVESGRGGVPARHSGTSERKQQRKFIRALLRDEEYGDPPCCPRMGILMVVWALAIIITALLLKYVLEVDFREMVMTDHDSNSCFMKVYLTEDI